MIFIFYQIFFTSLIMEREPALSIGRASTRPKYQQSITLMFDPLAPKFVDAPRTGRSGTGKLITQELGTKKLGNLELGNSPPVCKFVDAPRTGMSGTPQFVVSTHPDIYNLSNTGARGISGKRTRSQKTGSSQKRNWKLKKVNKMEKMTSERSTRPTTLKIKPNSTITF